MAKTKSSKQKKPDPQNQTLHNPTVMEENHDNPSGVEVEIENPSSNADPSTKGMVSNLQVLNAMLVKETVEKREEIKALNESKKLVETELTRSKSEVEALRNELIQVKEDEVTKDVRSVFMESQVAELLLKEKEVNKDLQKISQEMEYVMKDRDEYQSAKFNGDYVIGEMMKKERRLKDDVNKEKDRVNTVTLEKNELKRELDARVDELNRLKEKIGELESKERSVIEELEQLKLKYSVSEKALEEKKVEVESMKNKLSLMGRNCEDLRKEIEGLNGEKEENSRKNDELCNEKEKRIVRISELENEVNELNAVVSCVKEDAKKWRVNYFELEELNAGIATELKGLKNNVSDKEREMSRLVAEKSRVEGSLNELAKEFINVKQLHEETQEEKKKLQSELNEIRGKMALLQESNSGEIEKSKKLATEIDDQKRAINQVTTERDDAKKALDVEKKNGMALQVKVSEISKKMEETNRVLVGEKREIENKYSKLIEDKKLIEDHNAAVKREIDELNDVMKKKTVMFELVLAMLKNTVKQFSVENEDKGEDEGMKMNEQGFDELKPIVTELEAVRTVLRERGEKAGEMKQEMKKLQCSLKEVKKKKNFWTLVSSGTSAVLAAAVSYAYASRVG